MGSFSQYGNFNVQHYYASSAPAHYALLPVVPPRPPNRARLLGMPSRLLDARAAVVPFAGREAELRDLALWQDDPAPSLSVRLLHGVAGQGKSRLAGEFAELSRKVGWVVAAARHEPDGIGRDVAGASASLLEQGLSEALLLLVDYADRWPHSHLKRLFSDLAAMGPRQARVLLIGRSVEWYAAIRGELAELLAPADDRELASLGATVEERELLFRTARARFAELLELAPAGPSSAEPGQAQSGHSRPAPTDPGQTSSPEHADDAAVPEALADPASSAYATVLTVHMAALVAAYGAPAAAQPEALAAFLLDREYTTWARVLASKSPGASEFKLRRTAFVATLTGPLQHAAGLAALSAAGIGSPQSMIDLHGQCYVPADTALVLEPLYPDRLAEDYLALYIPGHSVTGYRPDPWTETALTGLLARDQHGAAPAYTPRSVTFLASAAARWPHVAAVVGSRMRDDPGLAVDAGGAALTAIAKIPCLGSDVLEGIASRFPDVRHADLDAGMAAVTSSLVREQLAEAPDDAARWVIRMGLDLPSRLLSAGRAAEALNALQGIVTRWGVLAAHEPDAYAAQYAGALMLRSSAYLASGEIRQAVVNAELSVKACREYAGARDRLPGALAGYSNALIAAGHLDAALAAATEAMQLPQPGAAQDAAVVEELATALVNQASALVGTGQARAGQAAAEAAVELWRNLSRAEPQTGWPGLALALNRSGLAAASAGDTLAALRATQEAVEIYRQLAKVNGAAYGDLLAGVLTNLGRDLAAVGRYSDALDVSREAVGLRRYMAREHPGAHRRALAGALNNLASRLAADRPEEAIAAASEAVEIQRQVIAGQAGIERHPTTESGIRHDEQELASMLKNLAQHFQRNGRPADGVHAAQEAAGIIGRLADRSPTGPEAMALRASLASTLSRLARCHLATGQADEASEAAKAAVDQARRPASPLPRGLQEAEGWRQPGPYWPGLAEALMTQGACHERGPDVARAAAAYEEAALLLSIMARHARQRFEPDLAAALHNLATCLHKTGRLPDSIRANEAAVVMWQRLAEEDPIRYGGSLAIAREALIGRHALASLNWLGEPEPTA